MSYDETQTGNISQKMHRTFFTLIFNQITILYSQNKGFKIKLPQARCEKISPVSRFLDINVLAYMYTFNRN